MILGNNDWSIIEFVIPISFQMDLDGMILLMFGYNGLWSTLVFVYAAITANVFWKTIDNLILCTNPYDSDFQPKCMKSVVVTGANRGIGLELVKQLLDSGFRVYATHRSEMGGLANLNNQNLSIHQMDVRDPAAIEELSNSIDGEIDLLINNAGVADGRWQSISEIDMQHALDVIEINSIAPQMFS